MRRPADIIHNGRALSAILDDHALWVNGEGGARADLSGASLRGAILGGADLSGANLCDANLRGADLSGASLRGAILRGADLRDANLSCSDLSFADLRDADLRALGNMLELRTMQIDRWEIGYTGDTLQIGCERHPIEKWRRWNTDVGRKWIAKMDPEALEWADRNLALVLSVIEANPATWTGKEKA